MQETPIVTNDKFVDRQEDQIKEAMLGRSMYVEKRKDISLPPGSRNFDINILK